MRTPMPYHQKLIAAESPHIQRLLKENRVSQASGLSSSKRIKTVEGRARTTNIIKHFEEQPSHALASFDQEVAAAGSRFYKPADNRLNSSEYGNTVRMGQAYSSIMN